MGYGDKEDAVDLALLHEQVKLSCKGMKTYCTG